ncbi:hypothetical protein [Hymenobacter sp. PAMC 26628]|uniref:hypothetical protein n=1 Tax=Hymenobacter sp. PAMC 26628 TaxID=1484118 RepID=UPI0012FFC2EB|nr:hypothetical protein [Hymenobacter sp. PAMC 26628]
MRQTILRVMSSNFEEQNSSRLVSVTMGMDYYISPNTEVKCENEFPERLSQFFEQIGGYGEFAEATQISKILDIDLSIFQDIDYDVHDKSEDTAHWHTVDEYLSTIENFINKLTERPTYYTQVLHGATPDNSSIANQVLRIATLHNESEAAKQWVELVPSQGNYLHKPFDNGGRVSVGPCQAKIAS